MPGLEIALLGSPQVTIDGVPVSVDTRKAIALLAYLAVTGQVHRRDRLAALLWPDAGHERARAALRRTLSTLNGALDGDWLAVTRDTIALRQSPGLNLDVARFRTAIATAREDPARGTESLEAAAALYRGAFMDGFHLRDSDEFDDWRYLEGETLRRDLAWALDQLSSRYGERGDFEAAISCALRWLGLDPLHEEAHRRLMTLYARSGQTAAAVRQYRECVRILEQELGVEPLDATTALYQTIQERREPAVLSRKAGHTPAAEIVGTGMAGAFKPAPPAYSLVGREQELATLESVFDASFTSGHLVVVEGEAGVGKTRLMETFLDRIRERGAGTMTLRCYEGEAQLTYGPIVDALKVVLRGPDSAQFAASLPARTLSEVGRLFPELVSNSPELPVPAPLDSPGARARFYDALLDTLQLALGGDRSGVLFVDDAQWIDGASLDLLAYMIRRLAGRPLLVLAWRGEQAPDDHRLRGLLAGAMRSGNATLVSLGRLQQRDVEALAREVADDIGDAGGTLGARLFRETDGLPFFVVQYLDELRQRHDDAGNGDWPLPGGVRDLLRARISNVSAEELQILATLSAVGAATSFDILLPASGRSEDELVTAVDRLLWRGLIVERDEGLLASREPLYDISHDKLRELIYAETNLLRRRLLHRRIAEALLGHARGQAQRAEFARVAHHFRLAGRDADAARAYREAADAAAGLYANTEAIGHYDAALALGYDDAATLHERIGDLQTRMGAYELALAAYEKAAALLTREESGQVEHKLGNLYHRLGAWDLADRHYAAAEPLLAASAGNSGSSDLARLNADRSLTAHRQGDRERARRLSARALEQAEAAGDVRALAQSHNLLGILARSAGDPTAREHLEESLRLARTFDDPEARAAALNNLALLDHSANNHERAISLGREALALAVLQGDRHREAALHSNLADFLHAAGQRDEAMTHLRESAVIYTEIGEIAGERQAEIWKLAEW